ncbi:MAG TPA: type II toxin-antitoxin system VapC family toxin [Acidobacteriota bacterium]|jgi:hypothetical protein|nr:type II toxin-antitoxin system VapC family toxin [Acidobacteriota bacterium]
MSRAAVDSSIILDILLDDPEFAQTSIRLLEKHLAGGAVVICPVAYSESAACLYPPSRFVSIAKEMDLIYEDFDPEVCTLAAHMWRDYRAKGGRKNRILADFLIGAHAQKRADVLLSRDRGFFRTYFHGLEVVGP